MSMLKRKRILIVSVASPRSIVWGIAESMHREGAELAFTYQTEKLKSRVDKVAKQTGSNLVMPLDVSSDEQIDDVFATLSQQWDGLHCIVHAVDFAPRDQIEGGFGDRAHLEPVDHQGFEQRRQSTVVLRPRH